MLNFTAFINQLRLPQPGKHIIASMISLGLLVALAIIALVGISYVLADLL